MKAVYLGEPDKKLMRFICGIKECDKATVAIGNDVVAKDAFKSAYAVENVHFEKCKLIEESAFENCADLKNVIWMEDSEENSKVDNNASKDGVSETNNAEKKERSEVYEIVGINILYISNLGIQCDAFKGCSSLQTVILPKASKIVIEKEAFGGCQNLRTIVFPYDDNQAVDISEDAFVGCSKVTFVCSNTSTANRYAREHGFEIVNIEG